MSLLRKYLHKEDDRHLLERRMKAEGRLPPGQSASLKWPVLHTGAVPEIARANWTLQVSGAVEAPFELDYAAFRALPRRQVVTDFHCVTRWSTFDNRWEGVPFPALLEHARVRPEATHVMALGHTGRNPRGYATNIPLRDLDRDDVLLCERWNGADLTAEHGGPVRLLVPHLYAWKSCKWLRGLVFMDADEPGFWERAGYHMYGDPFREQRFGHD